MKDFIGWNKQKIRIDKFEDFQHPKVGEIWWCRVGVNIGTEVYGKGEEFTRPVLVINNEGSESCICIPISSKVKNAKYSCVVKTDDDKLHTVMVYQIRSMDKRRFKERKYVLSDEEFLKVKKYFDKLWEV